MDKKRFVISTRETREGKKLSHILRRDNIKTISIPTILVKKLPLTKQGRRILARKDKYDWILFTSRNTVRFFASHIGKKRVHARIGAVGPETAEELLRFKLHAERIAPNMNVRSLVRSLPSLNGTRVLFPRSHIGSHDEIRMLRERGARVTTLPLYTTLSTQLRKRDLDHWQDPSLLGAVFASTSAVKGLAVNMKRYRDFTPRAVPSFAIGKKTGTALRREGFTRVHVAKEASAEGLAALIRQVVKSKA